MWICVCCPRWSCECTFFCKCRFLNSGLHCTQTNQLCRAYRLAKTYQKKERKEKNLHTHTHTYSLILASITLQWRAQGCIIAAIPQVIRVLTASQGVLSPAVVGGQEGVTAPGMLGLTEAVINYGLLPLVMDEKPTDSSKRSLNQGAHIKGNLMQSVLGGEEGRWGG